LCLLGLVAILTLPSVAYASFPGRNGKIAFSTDQAGNQDIWVINADGTGETRLTTSTRNDTHPAWSPDGSRIAFARDGQFQHGALNQAADVFIMNADGTGATPTGGGEACDIGMFGNIGVGGITWSPDGTRIAFTCSWDDGADGGNPIEIMNTDGTGVHSVTSGFHPDWAADGNRLAYHTTTLRVTTFDPPSHVPVPAPGRFASWSPDTSRIAVSGSSPARVYTVNPDGSGATNLTAGFDPSWSPDGSKIAFVDGGQIHVMSADGTNRQPLTSSTGTKNQPAWQPIPVNAYSRPRAAASVDVTLVPAYSSCTSPNRTHGPPLAFPSCAPPQQVSDELTVGAPDSNGKAARAEGVARYRAMSGDVGIGLELGGIYDAALNDYGGELRLRTSLRITDKRNTPHPGGPGAATVADISLGATAPCVGLANPIGGSSCALNTTANALAPGTVTSGARSVWGLGQVQVYDGGADGDGDTAGDNTLFMVQGVFVP
jgi:TolB protein